MDVGQIPVEEDPTGQVTKFKDRIGSGTGTLIILTDLSIHREVDPARIRQSMGRRFTVTLESVREHHAGLQSFRSMRRIEARRRKASALWLRHSQSLASRRQRPSQAKVRSTIQRLGSATKPMA